MVAVAIKCLCNFARGGAAASEAMAGVTALMLVNPAVVAMSSTAHRWNSAAAARIAAAEPVPFSLLESTSV